MDTNIIIEDLQTIIEKKIDTHKVYLLEAIKDVIDETKIELQDDLCNTIEDYINDKLRNVELAEDNRLNNLVKQLNTETQKN